jgi:K+-sensing histidine kinase KdpD
MSFKSSGAPGRLILDYGVAVASVATAILALSAMEAHWRTSAPVSLFLMAVIFSTLLGGIKPGLLAAALSILGFDYFSAIAVNGNRRDLCHLDDRDRARCG